MPRQQEVKSPSERQLIGLSTLLHLENQVRKASTDKEFAFFVVNDTLKLLQYRQAVLCQKKFGKKVVIKAVSGVDKPNRNAPYVIWLKKFFKHIFKKKGEEARIIQEISGDQLPGRLKKGWQEWGCSNGIWCPLIAPDKEFLGGIWLVRDTKWQETEKTLLTQLFGAYAHAWQTLLWRSVWRRSRFKNTAKRMGKALFLCGAAASLALPVPLTILAPAQIVPADPLFVTAPLKGVIKKFHVRPNQRITGGQVLFSFDDTELRNRFEVAKKTLDVARAEYKKARQKSLLHRESSFDITILKARVDQKQAEQNYVSDELNRVSIHAPAEGIAVFSDINDWIGRPVVTGEKIMTIADPLLTELEVHVPVDNAVNLEPGTKIRFFLNTDPSLTISGVINQASYEAQISAEGILAFSVKASIIEGKNKLRIGQQGTAKIYGKNVRLYYYLFRRPWTAIRKTLGV
ncbi:MAG: HlyD family efflux transporter periplasmic adaptor subunit [Desulfobacteraceae bacterium]|nr:HlyD family efflux transporter periplasmic adaptor subunit [Desulfobacteraceae bacterium]